MNQDTSSFVGALSNAEKSEVVREVYKKHSAELLAIEEAQQKLILVLLGIFGAAASFLSSEKINLAVSLSGRIGLTVIVIAVLALGGFYTDRRNKARASVRKLLIQCERSLGFYQDNIYLKDAPLYESQYQTYPEVGRWLGASFWLAVLAGIGFLVVLWSPVF